VKPITRETRRRRRPAALRRASVGGALGGVLLCAAPAAANGPIGSNGSPITTSRYAIDLFRGPVFAGSRVTGLGGAYVAIGWDVDGMLQNPAAPAVRPFFSVTYFDYWLGFGLTLPGDLSNMDFFNSGAKTDKAESPDSMWFITPAAMIQLGNFGFGLNLELNRYGLGTTALPNGASARLATAFDIIHVQAAYAFGRGELVLGMGSRILRMKVRLDSSETRELPFTSSGTGMEFGALWQPKGLPFSAGAAFRTGIETTASFSDAAAINEQGDVVFETDRGTFYLPERAVLPWDLNVGMSVELGAAPENVPWESDRDGAERQELAIRLRTFEQQDAKARRIAAARDATERQAIEREYEALARQAEADIDAAREDAYWELQRRMAVAPRHKVLLAASVLITGRADEAVGVESFLSQTVNRSGENVVWSPRLGAEMEVIPDWLRLRAGTYLEPTRFQTSTPRPHYTGGFDLRAVNWNVFGLWPDDYLWRIGVGTDVSRNYTTFSVTIAGWYPRHSGTVTRTP
jgi:hypothetical protein